jgi:hypothetical protein
MSPRKTYPITATPRKTRFHDAQCPPADLVRAGGGVLFVGGTMLKAFSLATASNHLILTELPSPVLVEVT